MSIKVDGLEEVVGALESLADIKKMESAVGKACALVERSAKQKAPKDTGALRRSIASRVERNGENIVGVVYTPLEYAPYIEYGTGLFAKSGGRSDVPWHYQDDTGKWWSTSGQHPKPFMGPALNDNREKILRILREGMSSD